MGCDGGKFMNGSNADKQAIVLSGGGSYGAYEVGVMKALFTGRSPVTDFKPLDVDVFVGTSAGSLNAAVIVSHSSAGLPAAVEYLENLWINVIVENPARCGNGVYRVRGPFEFLNLSCFTPNPLKPFLDLADDTAFFARDWLNRAAHFAQSNETLVRRTLELVDLTTVASTEPFHRVLSEAIPLEGIRTSDKALRVVTTNFSAGGLGIFTNQDIADRVGHKAILASSAVPGFFPPVEIDGQFYVDGGALMNTPVRPAIDEASILHVIYMDPDVSQIPIERLQNTIDTLDRLIIIALAYAINQQIETARDVNRSLELLEQGIDGNQISDADLRSFLRVASRIYQRIRASSPYKKLTIHRYHPREDLGGVLGLMNLDYRKEVGLIERGFNDAVNHNCEASGCVLVGQAGESSSGE
jgi:predicted acylesterase/phospholipase RssA